MKAVVFHGPGDVRLEAREVSEPASGHVVLRVEACGICGTDRHIYHGEFQTTPPVIIGHEFAGEVVAVGEDAGDLTVGDRVAVDPNIPCGTCRPCRRGKIQLCERLLALGVHLNGGFAEFCHLPYRQCYKLPPSLSTLEGAMAEPVACCVHGIDLAGICPGDVVAVLGGGLIGQTLAQLAKLAGAARVVLSDPLPARRQMALALGADAVVDPRREDPLAAGGPLAGGADVVIEAVGSTATTQQALAWAAPGATVLWFGVTPPGQTIAVEPNLLFRKELTIRGALVNPHTHARALALLGAGRVRVRDLITRTIPLEEVAQELAGQPGEDIKVVVIPGTSQ